jgi:hypothetical protein
MKVNILPTVARRRQASRNPRVSEISVHATKSQRLERGWILRSGIQTGPYEIEMKPRILNQMTVKACLSLREMEVQLAPSRDNFLHDADLKIPMWIL